jgi:hypothetical protein
MANTEKLRKEFYDAFDNMTDQDWNVFYEEQKVYDQESKVISDYIESVAYAEIMDITFGVKV